MTIVPEATPIELDGLEEILKATLPMGRIALARLPGCEQVRLALIAADFPLGPLPPEVMLDVVAAPAYWAFCWGSGLALAQYLLRHPEWVNGRTVLDLGAGSGVAGIAAKLAGARRVIACDTDESALAAVQVNAALNGVAIESLNDLDAITEPVDIVLMADVLYDRSNLPLLAHASDIAREVLVADSRIRVLADDRFRLITQLSARTYPNLGEFDEFTTVRIFHRAAGQNT